MDHRKQEFLIVVTINSQVTAIDGWVSANLEVVHMLAGRVRRVVIPGIGYPRIVQHASYVISIQQARLPEAYGQIVLVVMKPYRFCDELTERTVFAFGDLVEKAQLNLQ